MFWSSTVGVIVGAPSNDARLLTPRWGISRSDNVLKHVRLLLENITTNAMLILSIYKYAHVRFKGSWHGFWFSLAQSRTWSRQDIEVLEIFYDPNLSKPGTIPLRLTDILKLCAKKVWNSEVSCKAWSNSTTVNLELTLESAEDKSSLNRGEE